ncbi:hypothetical protein Tco_1067895 [Tanacetum coccineum]|uniref:RRM domain-containing protein n=1 Tax=Tanacetum coccineum TaxID=301880 RepID=A0ABQ5HE72_9ASTR
MVHSLRALSTLRRSGLRTASTAAKPCQGDSSESYLITGRIPDGRRLWDSTALWKMFNHYGKVIDMYAAFKRTKLGSTFGFVRFWGSGNKRALILGWAYYLDAFSSYPLRTWLPSVYRGHDNWYTREWYLTDGLDPPEGGLLHLPPKLRKKSLKLHRVFLSRCRYPFVEGRSSFSWEYGIGYFSAVAPGTRTLARGIFSTPSYPEKTGSPYALTHPPWTNLAEEPLGFRGIGFSPMFALLKPTFSLPLRPLPLARVLHSKAERSPTDANLLAVSAPLPPLSLSGHLGALAGDPGCFPLDDEAYPPSSHWPTLTPVILSQLLRLNAFRGEPASSGFEWHFTPNHNSSADSSTSVGSDLHLVSPKLHPGHG